jgi:hypothetical protein
MSNDGTSIPEVASYLNLIPTTCAILPPLLVAQGEAPSSVAKFNPKSSTRIATVPAGAPAGMRRAVVPAANLDLSCWLNRLSPGPGE